MKLQHPTTNETIVTRAGSPSARRLIEQGWKDITKPRSPKQIAQNNRWVIMGQMGVGIAAIDKIVSSRMLPYPKQVEILQQARSVLAANLKQLRGGG